MLSCPRSAGQTLVVAKSHFLAQCTKFVERPIKAVEEPKLRAVLGWNPDFRNPNEGPHRAHRSIGHGRGRYRQPDLARIVERSRKDLKAGGFAVQSAAR